MASSPVPPGNADYTNDLESLRAWIGSTQESVDVVTATQCNKMQHTLDRDAAFRDGDVMPLLWHFLTHNSSVPTSKLATDGHPVRGEFLPPVALPRRMWAGGRLDFRHDIYIGEQVTKRSVVEAIDKKEGRSGLLYFVTVRHDLLVDGQLRVREEQDLVYRNDPDPRSSRPEPKQAPANAEFSRIVTPSPAMLFRYSALTFNSHRIHYDVDYARDVEGYPDLVVHGPLTATLLSDLAQSETGATLQSFSFRGVAPLFGDEPLIISGRTANGEIELWASRPDGSLAMTATATVAARSNP